MDKEDTISSMTYVHWRMRSPYSQNVKVKYTEYRSMKTNSQAMTGRSGIWLSIVMSTAFEGTFCLTLGLTVCPSLNQVFGLTNLSFLLTYHQPPLTVKTPRTTIMISLPLAKLVA